MVFLPYENLKYHTPLTKEEIVRRLKRTFVSSRFGRAAEPPYEGTIRNDHFNIQRTIYYKNSFVPQISGKIIQHPDGCVIHITMQMHLLVRIMMIVFSLIIITIGIGTLGSAINQGFNIGMLVLPLLYLMTMLGFKIESRIAKRQLAKLFEARVIN